MTKEVKEAYMKIEKSNAWAEQFRWICEVSRCYPYQCKVARKHENHKRNRYGDVNPFDHTRVKLQAGSNDYINSSLVSMEKGNRSYILCQGPLGNTSGHMWQMVWEQNSKAVVMLNKIYEKGVLKCFKYWPERVGEKSVFPDVGLSVTLLKEEKHSNFVIRDLSLKKQNYPDSERVIYQFHYTSWPDFGVPESPDAFLQFMSLVQDCGVLEDSVGPAVIHCSAGIGRSGTFALVELCSQYLKQNEPFDVSDVLLELRKFRMGLIQTPEQLRFSYLAITRFAELFNLCSDESSSPQKSLEQTSETNSHDETENTHHTQDDGEKFEGSSSAPSNEHSERKRLVSGNVPIDVKKPRLHYPSMSTGSVADAATCDDDDGDQENLKQQQHQENMIRKGRYQLKNEALKKRVEEVKKSMRKHEESSSGMPWKRYVIGGLLVSALMGAVVRFWWQ